MSLTCDYDDRGIATVTLARPEKHNAMDAAMIAALSGAARDFAANPPRAVVLAAQGKSFCAGADLGWMRAQAETDRAGKEREAGALADMLGAWDALPCPVIARVQGPAYGGGLGLVAVADIAIASGSARFAFTETRLGLIPATISPFVVAKIGAAAARALWITARPFEADEALRLGLLSRTADDLDAAIAEETGHALKCAPGAMARAKALAKRFARDPRESRDATLALLADCWETEETRAGIAAFFDRRDAPWA